MKQFLLSETSNGSIPTCSSISTSKGRQSSEPEVATNRHDTWGQGDDTIVKMSSPWGPRPSPCRFYSVTVYKPESTCSSIFMHCCSPRLSRLQFAEFLPSSGHRYTSPVCFFPVDSKGAPTSNLQSHSQFESQTLFIMHKSRVLEKEGLIFAARLIDERRYPTSFIWLDIWSRAIGLPQVHFIIKLTKLMTFKYL